MSGDYGILEIGIALGTGMLGLALLCAVPAFAGDECGRGE